MYIKSLILLKQTRRPSLWPYLACNVYNYYFPFKVRIIITIRCSRLKFFCWRKQTIKSSKRWWSPHSPSSVSFPDTPPTEATGLPQDFLDPLHQETVWQRPNKRSDGEETDRQENHMDRTGNPHLLQTFREELVRDSYNHSSTSGWNFRWTLPGMESR